MASIGARDILITDEIVTREKMGGLATPSRDSNVMGAVHDANSIEQLSRIAQEHETEIDVLLNISMSQFAKLEGILDLCGVLPGKPAVSLAKKVVEECLKSETVHEFIWLA